MVGAVVVVVIGRGGDAVRARRPPHDQDRNFDTNLFDVKIIMLHCSHCRQPLVELEGELPWGDLRFESKQLELSQDDVATVVYLPMGEVYLQRRC